MRRSGNVCVLRRRPLRPEWCVNWDLAIIARALRTYDSKTEKSSGQATLDCGIVMGCLLFLSENLHDCCCAAVTVCSC